MDECHSNIALHLRLLASPARSRHTRRPGPEPTYHKIASGYKTFTSTAPFQCRFTDNANQGVLPSVTVAYETWGKLNEQRSNAVLIHTGLSATSHAASHQARGGEAIERAR
jgi:homoserine acetyltransferase